MKTFLFVRSILVLMMISVALSLAAQERFALVIGNGAYTSVSRLKNPVNDATDIAAALKRLGFKVTLLTNVSRREMNQGLNDFHDKLAQDPASAGFFWYAGHGVQFKGENYLIPIGADIQREVDLEDEAVSVKKLTDLLDDARNRLNIIVLDACRNNPLPSMGRSATRGLTVVGTAPSESVIMYSTGAGQVAADGVGRNSPFAQAFLKYLGQSGDITTTIKSITAETKRLTEGAQVPYLYSSLTLDFAFNTNPEEPSVGNVGTSTIEPQPQFGAVAVTPGSVVLSSVAAGILSFQNKRIPMPIGGTLPVNNLAPGDYQAVMTYADGSTETQAFHITQDATVKVGFIVEPPPTMVTGWKDYTTDNGLADDWVYAVTVSGSTVYAATHGGLSVSADGGKSWKNYTTANGLGDNSVHGVAVAGSTIFAATEKGLSISTDGGVSWKNLTTANGLGANSVHGITVSGTMIIAATERGISISTDGGLSWKNSAEAENGLGYGVNCIVASNSVIYAGTEGGLSVSTDRGASWTNYTKANGLGDTPVQGVAVSGENIYAATDGGLSVSIDGGYSWKNYTIAAPSDFNGVTSVAISGSVLYAGTTRGLSISTDQGESWKTYPTPTVNEDTDNNLLGLAISGSRIYAANGRGISVSTGSSK